MPGSAATGQARRPPTSRACAASARPTARRLPVFKAPVLTAWSWAGPYVGANIGYSAGRSRTDAAFSRRHDRSVAVRRELLGQSRRAIGGIQSGYNWQWGNWVAGVETDLQLSGQGATPTYVCPGAICNAALVDVDAPVTASFEQGHKLGFVRHRARTFRRPPSPRRSWPMPPAVWRWARSGPPAGSAVSVSTARATSPPSPSPSAPDIKAGWTVGAGLEGRLIGNWTGKIEYLYLDLGSISTVPTPAANSTVAAAFNSRITDNIVRLGVNYKFDPSDIWVNF